MSDGTQVLSVGYVGAYRKLLKEPRAHGLPYRPIEQCFNPSEVATPKHVLFRDYQQEVPRCPKVIFYIIMDELYPHAIAKAPSGDLGYKLEFIKL